MSDKKQAGLEIIAEVSGRGVDSLDADQNLVGDLGIDSPKSLQLLLLLEDRLQIEISDEDAAKMEKVGDVLDYLQALA